LGLEGHLSPIPTTIFETEANDKCDWLAKDKDIVDWLAELIFKSCRELELLSDAAKSREGHAKFQLALFAYE
jgi:hypothetical protein